MKRLFSAPTSVNLELTELCNVKCRHCYNFWRDESMGITSLNVKKLEKVIKQISEAGVFHVICTGGEPFANFDLLHHAIKLISKYKMSMSVNSNLMIVKKENICKLKQLGLDHILTSLPSPNEKLNDYIMNQKGSLEKIINGIKLCVDLGIRISVNMVITRQTKDQVYSAGKLLSKLGCQKLFITRSVPPTYSNEEENQNYNLTFDEQRKCLDDALKVKNDFGIGIGTLVSYPLCFLEDLEKYSDFVGRGCPAQAGHRMSINANGNVHACVHEEESYGNLLFQSVKEIYQSKMRKWHNRSFHYKECEGCRYIDVCESGCSMTSVSKYGKHEEKDPLYQGFKVFKKHYEPVRNKKILEMIEKGAKFSVPKRIRFRKENDFYLISIRWGNVIPLDTKNSNKLIELQKKRIRFTLNDNFFDKNTLLNLYAKDLIESKDLKNIEVADKLGLSLNFEALEPIPEKKNVQAGKSL